MALKLLTYSFLLLINMRSYASSFATFLLDSKGITNTHIINAISMVNEQSLLTPGKVTLKKFQDEEALAKSFLNTLRESKDEAIILPHGSSETEYLAGLLESRLIIPPPVISPMSSSRVYEKQFSALPFFPSMSDTFSQLPSALKHFAMDSYNLIVIKVGRTPNFEPTIKGVFKNISNVKILATIDASKSKEVSPNLWRQVELKHKNTVVILQGSPRKYHKLDQLLKKKSFNNSVFVLPYNNPHRFLEKITKHISISYYQEMSDYESSTYSLCDFSKQYNEKFGMKPDYHAVFYYAMFQVLSKLRNSFWPPKESKIKSIIGEYSWNKKGELLNRKPIFTFYHKNKKIFFNQKKLKKCLGPKY